MKIKEMQCNEISEFHHFERGKRRKCIKPKSLPFVKWVNNTLTPALHIKIS